VTRTEPLETPARAKAPSVPVTASDLEIIRTAHLWSAARRRRNRPQAVGNSVHRKRLPSRSDDLPKKTCISLHITCTTSTYSGFRTIYYQIG
jgi:hypothetical protein